MTHIETARFNELIGLQIGAIQETVHKLNENRDLEELESIVAELESTITDLKRSLAAFPHKHP
jgi:tetrahydromethanopterin S-methyltransferase subunit B